jgi:hypothetical protein
MMLLALLFKIGCQGDKKQLFKIGCQGDKKQLFKIGCQGDENCCFKLVVNKKNLLLPVEVPWHVDEFGSENDDAVALEDGLGDRSGQAAQHVTRTVNLDRL